MIRSLRTGVSGLKSNQTQLDVVGNNIANVNTVAFKRSRVAFNEVLGEEMLGVGRTAGGSGINPSHVGLGVSVGSIDQNWEQGSIDNTGVKTDLALKGDGYFVAEGDDRRLLTRAGNFSFNRNGELVTSSGLSVQGYGFDDETGNVNTARLEDVKIDPNEQVTAEHSTLAEIGKNLSAELEDGDKKSITTGVYDEQGAKHTVTIEFEKTGNQDEWNYTVKDGAAPADSPFQDGNGPAEDGLASGTIQFDTKGKVTQITDSNSNVIDNPSMDWDPSYVSGGESVEFDFSGLTQHAGSTTAVVQDTNGQSAGQLTGYSIDPSGTLQANFSNGEQKNLYQLAIGTVNNPNGLQQEGENFYSVTSASGDLQLGRAGRDLNTAVVGGALESSNVDIATEFSEMITAQRGYQASARLITTSDEILQEAVQLKR